MKEEITKEDYERALLFPMDTKIVYAYEEQERKKKKEERNES